MIKTMSSKSDEGALRNMTPKNTNFRALTDFSAPYTLATSSFHIYFMWNSIGHANGIISCIAWDDGGHSPEKPET